MFFRRVFFFVDGALPVSNCLVVLIIFVLVTFSFCLVRCVAILYFLGYPIELNGDSFTSFWSCGSWVFPDCLQLLSLLSFNFMFIIFHKWSLSSAARFLQSPVVSSDGVWRIAVKTTFDVIELCKKCLRLLVTNHQIFPLSYLLHCCPSLTLCSMVGCWMDMWSVINSLVHCIGNIATLTCCLHPSGSYMFL